MKTKIAGILLIAKVFMLLIILGIAVTKDLETEKQYEMSKDTIMTGYLGAHDNNAKQKKKMIKWVDFNITYEALDCAYNWDIRTHTERIQLDWIELLSYAACRGGGKFGAISNRYIDTAAKTVSTGQKTMQELTEGLQNYEYYKEVYEAVLGGYIGEYDENGETKYGLLVYSPIAKGFYYSDYDDFGTSRSYGYKRPHLGHDMSGLIGTPIIAVESGYVEALGWNRYGGWRIGIRSHDAKRYYYYAHLRQNRPYAIHLKEGDKVNAGQVIGYMGHTGYSNEENVNNIEVVHLHFGIQLIFDESQKDGDNEIWIDCYQLTKFLYKNRSEVKRDDNTKEWYQQ